MRRHIACFLLVAAAIFLASPTLAIEFQPLGFESASMGGAGVASAKGSFAAYYNPALLSEYRHGMQISLSAGVGMREVNVADHIDKLVEADIGGTLGRIADNAPVNGSNTQSDQDNVATIKNELAALSGKNGIQIMPSAVFGIQIGNFGFGAYNVSEATAYAVIDPNRLDLILEYGGLYAEYDETKDEYTASNITEYEARSFDYAMQNDLTYLKLTGLAYMEVPLAFGFKFSTPIGKLGFGASFKAMPGYTYDQKIAIDTESGDLGDEMSGAENKDSSFGFDLGMLYKPSALENLTLGIVGKNLNTPKFETATGGTMAVKPQIRAGLAYDFWSDRLTMALDADLTRNETFIPGYNSQFIGGGINFHPFSWLSLRGGVMRNLQQPDDGSIFTAGLGFGLKWFQLDVTGQVSDKQAEFEESQIPRYMRVQIALVSKWL